MATLTIRNLPDHLVDRLKELAKRNRRSMEAEVRELLGERIEDRVSVLEQLEEAWERQSRRPTSDEIDTWIESGRP